MALYRKPITELPYGITVLPATRHSLNPSKIGWYSIYLPRRERRLSWPKRLVAHRDGLPARRQSPIQVLTGPDVS